MSSFNNMRANLRDALIESYKPKGHNGLHCAICNRGNLPLAMHVLEMSLDETANYPVGFVPLSSSRGRVRGSFPICISCAPVCKKCGLPVPTEKVLEYGHANQIKTGLGICEHIQWRLFAVALLKKLFKKGRFSVSAKESLKTPELTDEMRGVFDRMFSSDDRK